MEENEDEPNDVQKATPVEEEITRGEVDEHSGKPSVPIELAKKRHHCEKDSTKKIKKSLKNEGECCRAKLANAARGHSKTATVLVYEKECTLPKIKPIPRHCLTKDEWIDLLATPSRKCPSPCLQREVTRKIRPVSTRMAELAQPPKNRLLNTLQDRGATLPTELVDHLIQTLEGEACLTPEQAERMFRDKDIRGRKKCRKRKSRLSCKGSSSKSSKREDEQRIQANASGFDKEAVNCQYMMAESFVRSILDWKCPIPKDEFKDIAEVILKRLGYVLEYNPVNGEDRKSQQMRFLADVVASWISGVLFDVAQARKEEMEKECERKRKEQEEESEEESEESEEEEPDDDDDDQGGRKKKGGGGGPPGGGGKDDESKKGKKGKKDDEDDDKKGGKPEKREEEKKDDSGTSESEEKSKGDDGTEPTEENVEHSESRSAINDSKAPDDVFHDARGSSGLDFDGKMTQAKEPIMTNVNLEAEAQNAFRDELGNELRGEAMGQVVVPEEIGGATKIDRLVEDTVGEKADDKAAAVSKDGDEAKTAEEAEKEATKILHDEEEAKKKKMDDKVADKPEEIFAAVEIPPQIPESQIEVRENDETLKTSGDGKQEIAAESAVSEEAKKEKMDDKAADKPEEIFAAVEIPSQIPESQVEVRENDETLKTSGDGKQEIAAESAVSEEAKKEKMDDKVADKPEEIFAAVEIPSQIPESQIEGRENDETLNTSGDGKQEIAAESAGSEEEGRVEAVLESLPESTIPEPTPAVIDVNVVPEKILIDSAEKEETEKVDDVAKEAKIDERAAGDKKGDEMVATKTEALGIQEPSGKPLEAVPVDADEAGRKIQEDTTLSSTLEDSTSPIIIEEPKTTLKHDEESTKIRATLSEAKDKRETPRRKRSKIPSSVVVKRKGLQSETQLVTFDKIFHTIYNAIEASGENSGLDAITNRLHRAVYEKCSNVVQEEKKEPLTDLTKDVLDVMSGKIAIWLRDVLNDAQLSFMNKFPATVESIDVREWTKWIENISDTANTWSTWIRETMRKAETMGAGKVTRGDYQDWTKSVEEDALLWRRFYLQSVHEAHHNLTMIRDREIVKTGTTDVNGDYEEEIKITDL